MEKIQNKFLEDLKSVGGREEKGEERGIHELDNEIGTNTSSPNKQQIK